MRRALLACAVWLLVFGAGLLLTREPAKAQVIAPNAPSLRTGLVAYWRMDEASNANRLDASGNGHTMLDGSGAVPQVAGKIGNAASFDGSANGYLATADGVGLPTNGSFSISAWVYLNSPNTSAGNVVISKWGAATHLSWSMRYDATIPRHAWTTSSTGSNSVTSNNYNGTLTLDAWHHYVMARTSTGPANPVYLDGSLVGTTAQNIFNDGTSQRIAIGGEPDGATFRRWIGRIDEVGVWDRQLTSTEVTALYNGGRGLSIPFTTPSGVSTQ